MKKDQVLENKQEPIKTENKTTEKLNKYSFPLLWVVIEAKTFQEAQKKAKKLK